jgi:hypothetical protein
MTAKISFTRSESWEDYRGKQSFVYVKRGKTQIGEIQGHRGQGVRGPLEWTVLIEGVEARTFFDLSRAKAFAERSLTSVNNQPEE